MQINVALDNVDQLLGKQFSRLGNQMKYAMVRTINSLAYEDVKPAFISEMKRKLDNPTRFTLNSVGIAPAKKSNMAARTFVRNEASKGTPPADYLAPNATGGPAHLKRSEKLLQRRGVLKRSQRLIPGRRTKLNRYGNWSGAQMNKALSNIGHQHDRWQNTNRNTRVKKGRARYTYFLIRNGHPKLTPGIWKEERGWAYPWVLFADNSQQRKRVLDFHSTSERVVRMNATRRAKQAINHALATAR
ncbi:TPA: hypothetical protein KDY90_002634 [Vibrio parahaemolyticus]|nr:hypothetical protein [Vibrio parahaemolyticus]